MGKVFAVVLTRLLPISSCFAQTAKTAYRAVAMIDEIVDVVDIEGRTGVTLNDGDF